LPGSTPHVVHTLITATPAAGRPRATSERGRPSSPPPEQLVELALPLALFLRRHQHRDDLLLCQHVDDAGWFDCTSLRVGSRPTWARNCWPSRLSRKLAASRAAFGCGALAFPPTWPKNSVTGSSAHTSIDPPASLTFIDRFT